MNFSETAVTGGTISSTGTTRGMYGRGNVDKWKIKRRARENK